MENGSFIQIGIKGQVKRYGIPGEPDELIVIRSGFAKGQPDEFIILFREPTDLPAEVKCVSSDYLKVKYKIDFYSNSFRLNDEVSHKKGTTYKITAIPVPNKILEYCGEEYYEYKSLKDETSYIRRKSEMEDGRFTLI